MFRVFKTVLVAWFLRQTFGRMLAVLMAVFFPVAMLLKGIGLPLLLVLLVLGAPVLVLLVVIGLPFLLAFGAIAFVLATVFALLSMGMMLLKLLLPIVLAVWIVRCVWGWMHRPRNGGDEA